MSAKERKKGQRNIKEVDQVSNPSFFSPARGTEYYLLEIKFLLPFFPEGFYFFNR
jgi:hypothetical protein